jgi:hypothetical protein
MALIVEDGSIVENADSYVEVADADTYHTNMGNSAWTNASTAQKEAALRKATQYIDTKYEGRWKGMRVFPAQPLMWPRNYVLQYEESSSIGYAQTPVYVNSDEIPKCLRDAVCEAALRSLSKALDPDLDRGGHLSQVVVGPIQTTYERGASVNTRYQAVERLLRSLLKGGGSNSVEIVRA